MSALSGLAASIRASTEIETFDLAGKNASTIKQAVLDAFKDPFPLQETVRLTFVTGAGKLGRQKYDEGAARAITGNLREMGYEEDHGGGAGTFKLQHDTGKNLKTVVVYPTIVGEVGTAGIEGDTNAMSLNDNTVPLLPEGSPEHKIALTSMNVFDRMITSMCPSWSQKKGCAAAIDEIKELCKKLDEKLLSGQPLSDSEQSFYDDVSMSSLEEKETLIREMMHKQVDNGQITADERRQLLSQVSDRLENLEKDKAEAGKLQKPKRVENLSAAIGKAAERQEKMENTAVRAPHPLKKQAEINKLRTELTPLLEMEAAAKGRLLSLKESQAMGRKEEIEEEIEELEEESRGWFESDEAFEARLRSSKASFKPPAKKKAASKSAGGGGNSANSSKTSWSTPGSRKTTSSSNSKKNSTKGNAGSVFAAMMMDSDSD
mmetsp:Transcript_3915/g.5137  ORF Transcript_3915/g.5137 Transcript_3915/m.5137 type:complete len:433 (+) Transcript_3915:99-1397(+)